ncbi:hypothetical protein D9M69_507340 [compost metagenome]
MARGPQDHGPGRRLGIDQPGPEEGGALQERARPGRLRARRLEHRHRDDRRGQRFHRKEVRPGPRGRLLADPGHVDGLVRRRRALPEPARRRLPVVLRLVLRPAAGQPADLGRTDRRARIGRLVQLDLPDGVGLQRAADAHARRALLHRSPLQGHQDCRRLVRLRRDGQVRRHLAGAEARHRCRAGDGHGPRGAEGIPRQRQVRLLPRLRQAVHRHADAGAAAREPGQRWHAGARSLPARLAPRRQPRRSQPSRVEDTADRRCHRRDRRAQRLDRLPLGRGRPQRRREGGPLEPGTEGRRQRPPGRAAPVAAQPAR